MILFGIFRDNLKFIDNLVNRLASNNILFVKIFQAFAFNNSLIDDETNNKLLKFTDNVPWTTSDINFYELIDMTDKYNLIVEFEKPMNSGMISLVFKAQQRETGKQFIIKIKRNNIEQQLSDAIDNIKIFVYFLSFFPLINQCQLVEFVNKNIDIIKNQTDFVQEVNNILKFKNNCKNLKYVEIPFAFIQVTKDFSNIILMEFINGVTINKIEEEDLEHFAKQVIKFGFVTTLIHGVAHGDLHGGNILFIKEEGELNNKYKYKIGVIDFGIIYELDTKFKENLCDFITQVFQSDVEISAIKFLNLGLIDPPGFLEKIPKEHSENIIKFTYEILFETINSKKANQSQMFKFLFKLKDYLDNSKMLTIGIKPSNNCVKLQLVLAMTHGVTLSLCKKEYLTLTDAVINDLFHTKLLLSI
jgi:ubiquinone biosynthesis protein